MGRALDAGCSAKLWRVRLAAGGRIRRAADAEVAWRAACASVCTAWWRESGEGVKREREGERIEGERENAELAAAA